MKALMIHPDSGGGETKVVRFSVSPSLGSKGVLKKTLEAADPDKTQENGWVA